MNLGVYYFTRSTIVSLLFELAMSMVAFPESQSKRKYRKFHFCDVNKHLALFLSSEEFQFKQPKSCPIHLQFSTLVITHVLMLSILSITIPLTVYKNCATYSFDTFSSVSVSPLGCIVVFSVALHLQCPCKKL